jgi:hypothetical protein
LETVLWLGASGTMYGHSDHDDYYRGESESHQKREKRAHKMHQKSEKEALKEHQREERRYYGNDRAIREHQQQECDELKYHQRNEKDRLEQHQDSERGDYYYNDGRDRDRYRRDHYDDWR